MQATTFYHTTVLLKEAVDGLDIKPSGIYVDATFGGGGHSREILSRLGPKGKLFAFDHDEDAWRNKPEDARLIPVTENFRYMRRFLRLHGNPQVDGILADLGVSSWQFDTAERGFSTRFDGPLDMRMDSRAEKTAAQVLSSYSEKDLHRIFEQYGEVRNARELARYIVANRSGSKLTNIESLKSLITPIMKGNPAKYLAQLFQALRIEVNEELDALKEFLEQTPACLKEGGRISVISFHSLEDRLVKTFMKGGMWEVALDEFGRQTSKPLLKPLHNKPTEPTEDEISANPRSRSAPPACSPENMSEEQHIETPATQAPEPMTPAQRIRADWKALISRLTYKGMVSNIPYVAFVALLCIIYIANNHRAVETQRELNKQQQTLKELRWRYMDIKTRLMNAGMETEMIRRGEAQGLKPLLLPAYSIKMDSSRSGEGPIN